MLLCMLGKMGKRLAAIGLAALIGAAGGCTLPRGRAAFDGKVGDAHVKFYMAHSETDSRRMEVTKDGVTWIYVHKDDDDIADYAERIEGENVSAFEDISKTKDPFLKGSVACWHSLCCTPRFLR